MPKKSSVDDVLAKGEVSNVRPETSAERIVRLIFADFKRFAALIVILIGIVGSLLIMIWIVELRSNAFQLFSGVITGALGYFFGTKSDREK